MYSMFGVLVAAMLSLSAVVAGADDISREYHLSTVFAEGDYILHWEVDMQTKAIIFSVNVSTTGWVGFGLSPTGQMPGSDVVIGWVDNDGLVKFHDRHAINHSLPLIDESQDWTLIRGLEEDGHTILEFSRAFISCDEENDLDITVDTSRIVWSYHSRDPTSLDELGELVHDKKGSSSLNLLGSLPEGRVEEDHDSFSILSDNVLIPANDTTYWCSVHAMPNELVEQERYMYKFSPVVQESSMSFVHHMVLYLCDNLNHSHVGTSESCLGFDIQSVTVCRYTGILFAAWGVGGPEFVFPNGVAYPIGGKSHQFLILEVHYDNPKRIEGVVDNSGLKLFYVSDEPEQRAGLLTFGSESSSKLVIPPGADSFVINAMCPSQCTHNFFPKEGINMFGNFLHTHLAGRGLIVRHYRETEECGGLEELQPIDENRRYDFNYQQTTILPRIVKALPGDVLHLQCRYQTTDSSHQGVTLGGESTYEEMCLTFLYYYPESNLTYCIGSQLASQEFIQDHINPEDRDALYASWQIYNDQAHHSVSRILNQVKWNQQSISSFQNSVQSNNISASCLNANDIRSSIFAQDVLPVATCPYQPPSKDCPTVNTATTATIGVSGGQAIYMYQLCSYIFCLIIIMVY